MILIRRAKVLLPEGVQECNLLIEDNIISSVGDVKTADKTDLVIDGKGKAVIPGLMNCHTHAAMTLFRGYADDMKLHEWLETKIWPLEAKLDGETVYWGTKLACLEMLKSGTTFFADMYFYCEDIARAVSDMGMRACISSAFFDFFNPDILEENMRRVEKDISALEKYERVIPSIGPHAVYTVSLDGLKRAADLANEKDIPIHFHLAETEREVLNFKKKYGKRVIHALDEIGFLSSKLVAAHSVWLDNAEIQLLARRGVNAVHCPASNMKLCVGRAINFAAMRDAGVNVCIGTDGAASNNNLNMFEEMKFAALLQKFFYNNPTLLRADEVFVMATVNAARAFGLRTGVIKEGCLADLVVIDLKKTFMSPAHNLIANLVYSASPECVDIVIVDGEIIIENGTFQGNREIEEEIIEKASEAAFNLAQG